MKCGVCSCARVSIELCASINKSDKLFSGQYVGQGQTVEFGLLKLFGQILSVQT